MKYFANPESNLLFTAVILVESAMNKLQKKFEDSEISPEKYIEARKKILGLVQECSKSIEDECMIKVSKKPHVSKAKAAQNE